MAADVSSILAGTCPDEFMGSTRHHGTRYDFARLLTFAEPFLAAALRGEIGPTTVRQVCRDFNVPDALVRTVLQQADGARELNFVKRAVLQAQGRDLVRDGRRIAAWVRTQPTCPLPGVRVTYAGEPAFGLADDLRSGSFDTPYLTFTDHDGTEQSIAAGGSVKAQDRDRDRYNRQPMLAANLAPRHKLSLARPTAAMFAHAGAGREALAPALRSDDMAAPCIFLAGRYEGPAESTWLASAARTAPIVNETGYQQAARDSLGDGALIVVEAEGSSPDHSGVDERHEYIRADGTVVSNDELRHHLGNGDYHEVDDWIETEQRGLALLLMAGELRATTANGGHEGGQLLLLFKEAAPLCAFAILNRSDDSRYWTGTEGQLKAQLQILTDAFAMLEAPDSTAGATRRQQFMSLEDFDVPMSDPSGRENVWTIASAIRQGLLPTGKVPAGSSH